MNTYLASYKSADESQWFKSLIEAPGYEVARIKAKAKASYENVTYCVIQRISRAEALDWMADHGREKLVRDYGPNRDSKGNWIGPVANENGWTP